MKVPPTFEIRVALIGYVSVGKTTVLNALLGAKYAEVAMKRTTAVVNNFRLSTQEQVNATAADVEAPHHDKQSDAVNWAMYADSTKSSSYTLEETVKDNMEHRSSDTVIEKTFDVVLEEALHEMRQDTKLVIVDIPGINEAGIHVEKGRTHP